MRRRSMRRMGRGRWVGRSSRRSDSVGMVNWEWDGCLGLGCFLCTINLFGFPSVFVVCGLFSA